MSVCVQGEGMEVQISMSVHIKIVQEINIDIMHKCILHRLIHCYCVCKAGMLMNIFKYQVQYKLQNIRSLYILTFQHE